MDEWKGSERMTPLKAIRLKCLDCSGTAYEVKMCTATGCPLYIYRDGHNPARKGIGNKISNNNETNAKMISETGKETV